LPTATINGVEIAYTDEGSGTPVVFIHGFPLSRAMWDGQVKALSGQARVIAIDLRGHGESQAFHWLTTMDTYADEVHGLLDHLNIERAVICGFSMGGYVTFAFYRKYPDRVHALILADTRPQPDAPEGKVGRFNTAMTAQNQGAGAIAQAMLPRLLTEKSVNERSDLTKLATDIMVGASVAGITGDLMAMAERPDSVEMLPGISVPTLVIVGENDALTPPADAQLMAERIPNARLETIPAAAHLSNVENPDAFNRAVGDFLKTLG
jgi:3-oxoadipate enol-lactonase